MEYFYGQKYESSSNTGYLYMDHELDLEKLKIMDDILFATSGMEKFNHSYIVRCKDEVLNTGELPMETYNKLVKIYYKWHIEEKITEKYKHRKCEI